MKRIILLTAIATALAAGASAQPKLPSIFQFPVDLSGQPTLAKAGPVDVRVRLRDAAKPDPPLHEEIFKGLDPKGVALLYVRLGLNKPIARDSFVNRVVLCETEARLAGKGAYLPLAKSEPVRLVFEKPKTVWEKIRLDRWVILGFAGQFIFMMRFFLQWIASERAGESTIPIAFWYCSLVGGLIVLVYGLVEREPIIIVGQSCGFTIYLRNLYFVYRSRRRNNETLPSSEVID